MSKSYGVSNEVKDARFRIATIVTGIIALLAFFLPMSSGVGMFSFDMKYSYNFIGLVKLLFGIEKLSDAGAVPAAFNFSLIVSILLLLVGFICIAAIVVMAFMKIQIPTRRKLSTIALLTILIGGFAFNGCITSAAEVGNNFYGKYPEFRIGLKNKTGSVNTWGKQIEKLIEKQDERLEGYENKEQLILDLQAIADEAAQYTYDISDSQKKKANKEIFEKISDLIPVEKQEEFFLTNFKAQTVQVSAISSTFGIGYMILIVLCVVLCSTNFSERNNGVRCYGIFAYQMYAGVAMAALALALFLPIVNVEGDVAATYGLTGVTLPALLLNIGKIAGIKEAFATLGVVGNEIANGGMLMLAFALFILSLVVLAAYIVLCVMQKVRIPRRFVIIGAAVLNVASVLIANGQLKESGIGISVYALLSMAVIATSAIICFTTCNDKELYKVFSIVNVIIFILITAFIIVPMWKVLVDSFDAMAGYGMKLWPEEFTFLGYKQILTNPSIYKPFLISCITTLAGTLIGLILSTLGAYVLVQFEMPGRNFLANMLLFTLIFQGGMVPTYLVLQQLGILNTLWAVILPLSINVYNLVLMRNFFEGIPKGLMEAAMIDGCSPMGIFIKIVLPLSKAALASIGLMFAVAFWNDYTNFKIYITNNNLHNFQMKLRAMIFSSDLPNVGGAVSENTLQNAAIIVAIIPFMILYPICQKYFVTGVNIGAVKE